MGHLILPALLGAIGVALTVIVSVAGKLIADDIKAWLPHLIAWLIDCSVRKLPSDQRDRYAEEWRSYVDEIPGDLSKVWAALSFVMAAGTMLRGMRLRTRVAEIALVLCILPAVAPTLILLALAIKLSDPHLPIIWRNDNGLIKFRTLGADGQVTQLGSVLRLTSVDELPSLLNVFRGKITFLDLR